MGWLVVSKIAREMVGKGHLASRCLGTLGTSENRTLISSPPLFPSLPFEKNTLSISAPLISNHLEYSRRRCGLRRLRVYVNAIRDGCDQALTYRIPLEPVRNENFEDGTLRKTWEHTSISTFKPIPGAYSLRVSQPFKHSNSITSVRAHPTIS